MRAAWARFGARQLEYETALEARAERLLGSTEFNLSVIEWVNKLRTTPQQTAAYLRERLAGCYDGGQFTPPWAGGAPEASKEGEAALLSLQATLEATPPLEAVHLVDALSDASRALLEEVAASLQSGGGATPRGGRSTLHSRLRSRGVWSGVAGEGVSPACNRM